MRESTEEMETFNKLVMATLTMMTDGWTSPNKAALSSKDYRLEVEYSGSPTNTTDLVLFKKTSGYAAPGEIKPGLILMGGIRLLTDSGLLTRTGHFTLPEMTVALKELYDREHGMAVPGKQLYTLLEPFIDQDDKITVFKHGKDLSISVIDANGRVELHITKEFEGFVDFDYLVAFRKGDPNTAIRSKWGPMEALPQILVDCVELAEERKLNVVRRVRKYGKPTRTS